MALTLTFLFPIPEKYRITIIPALAISAELLIVIRIDIMLTQMTEYLIHERNSRFKNSAIYNPTDKKNPA